MKKIFFSIIVLIFFSLFLRNVLFLNKKNSVSIPWPEYPRPNMVRNDWLNLNGLWHYAITSKDTKPTSWDGQILVPYPVESALSQVKKPITQKDNLWYKTTFSVPQGWQNKNLILNFEASDWETKVWIDGNFVGTHQGGYDPFSFDITQSLNNNLTHEILVQIWDPTDNGTQPSGKQSLNPQGIWYTASSGIWQTVWLEPVNSSHISSFKSTPNIDQNTFSFFVNTTGDTNNNIEIIIQSQGQEIASGSGQPNQEIKLKINNPTLWTPDNPFLYNVVIKLKNNQTVIDQITSVVGMRKISLNKTPDGFTRIFINNQFVYQQGVLDQGFWPDSLYTPPSDQDMVSDLKTLKNLGFNMLRKHVKVENRRFYNWCDKMGILVWQDMPSSNHTDLAQYQLELNNLIDTKYNHPSIIVWVPFNESWGLVEPENITQFIKEKDSTRLVDTNSGENNSPNSDITDIHFYPGQNPLTGQDKSNLINQFKNEKNKALVVGEFGGLQFPIQYHLWQSFTPEKLYFTDIYQFQSVYQNHFQQIQELVNNYGLSASVYTQLSDIETEINGLMTYDRKFIKVSKDIK